MPQFIPFALAAGNAVATFAATQIGGALISTAIGVGISVIASSLQKTDPPKAADGKYNLKQPVPPLVRVYGTVRKGGEYRFT